MIVTLFRRWRLLWCYRRFSKSNRGTLDKVLSLIHPDLLIPYQPLIGLEIALNTNRAHLTQVLEDLSHMRECVERGGYIDKKKIDTRYHTTLDDFLTTEEDVPLNLVQSINQIRLAYQQYHVALSKVTSQKADYYNRHCNRVKSDVEAFVHAIIVLIQKTR